MENIERYIDQAEPEEVERLLAAAERRLGRGGKGRSKSRRAAQVYDGIAQDRHLDATQLARLTDSFKQWCDNAGTSAQRRSRGRILLAFLFLRYGALRLGELLALNDRDDVSPENAQLIVRGQYARKVQMPDDTMRQIADLLEDPMFYSIRGKIFEIDQGYLRRKFYERGKAAGVAPELVSPRGLRHARALELLKSGVPSEVVHSFLGQPLQGLAESMFNLESELSKRIVQNYLNREVRMKTSARNVFNGKVTRLVKDGFLVEVEMLTPEGLKLVSVITDESCAGLDIAVGSPVTASVKAPWVILTENEAGLKTSARNKFTGRISEVKTSEIAVEVLVDLQGGARACAIVTRESATNLDLKAGKEVLVMFKAFAVILNVD